MGCGNCGSSANGGKPNGCKSNGNCSTGGCNRLNVHDWLSDIPVADFGKPFPIVELSFKNGSRKDFYRLPEPMELQKGQYVAVEGSGGFDVGNVSLSGELVRLQMKKKKVREDDADIKKILRYASESDIEKLNESRSREMEIMILTRVIINRLKLDMKLSEVEIQADGKKACYYYTAEDRVDFRELIRTLSNEFKMKVEMKQIGIRQEAGKIGGIGSCGRELCCSTWLTKFNSVSTAAARYQNLSINQTKLSGQCGRLKCCLNFELDTYMDALTVFPAKADKLKTSAGTAYLQKRDIFKNLLWYSYPGSSKLYPLSIERVNTILEMNKKGEVVDEMKPVELEPKKGQEKEMEYVDLVGQISLKSLDKGARKKRANKPKGAKRSNTPNQKTSGVAPQGENKARPKGDASKPNRPNPSAPQAGNKGGNKKRPQRPRPPRKED